MHTECFEDVGKALELANLLEDYRDSLTACHHIDPADLVRLALEAQQSSDAHLGPDVLVLIPADLRCRALERRLLDGLPAAQRIWLGVDEPVLQTGSKPATDLDLLCWRETPRKAPPPFRDGTLQMFRAIGEMGSLVTLNGTESRHRDWD